MEYFKFNTTINGEDYELIIKARSKEEANALAMQLIMREAFKNLDVEVENLGNGVTHWFRDETHEGNMEPSEAIKRMVELDLTDYTFTIRGES